MEGLRRRRAGLRLGGIVELSRESSSLRLIIEGGGARYSSWVGSSHQGLRTRETPKRGMGKSWDIPLGELCWVGEAAWSRSQTF